MLTIEKLQGFHLYFNAKSGVSILVSLKSFTHRFNLLRSRTCSFIRNGMM